MYKTRLKYAFRSPKVLDCKIELTIDQRHGEKSLARVMFGLAKAIFGIGNVILIPSLDSNLQPSC